MSPFVTLTRRVGTPGDRVVKVNPIHVAYIAGSGEAHSALVFGAVQGGRHEILVEGTPDQVEAKLVGFWERDEEERREAHRQFSAEAADRLLAGAAHAPQPDLAELDERMKAAHTELEEEDKGAEQRAGSAPEPETKPAAEPEAAPKEPKAGRVGRA